MNNVKWALLGLVFFLSLVDIASSILGVIPVIGDLFSNVSNAALEVLQMILVALLAVKE